MDIQVSSNFERLLFEMNGRDGGLTAEQLHTFRSSGRLSVEPDQVAAWLAPTFRAASLDDEATLAVMRDVWRESGHLLDPHTAVGLGAGRRWREDGVATIALGTAHPAKFPEAVEAATGVRPGLPPHLSDLFDRPERVVELPDDLAAVERFVASTARV
jgi:threonine synthase